MKVNFYFMMLSLTAACACEKYVPVPGREPEEIKTIELIAPADGAEINLADVESVTFDWKAIDDVNTYKIRMSLSEEMTSPVELSALQTPLTVSEKSLDTKLAALGIDYDTPTEVFWTVDAWGSNAETSVRSLWLTRKPYDAEAEYQARVADPIVVKVAVVYENPPMTNGKRLHEKYGYNNPYEQVRDYEFWLEKASHGVIDYQIVAEKHIEEDPGHFWSYDRTIQNPDGSKAYHSVEFVEEILDPSNGYDIGIEDEYGTFDYTGMAEYYGFGQMRDAGELHEIWVYTHPASGMYESRLMGAGAFWCNSPGITNGAPCQDLMCVMFCNFEREVALAIHSHAHRVESIMNQVYGSWNYGNKPRYSDLTNWELFSAYEKLVEENYSEEKAGFCHIGMCHWPPNARADYDYGNKTNFVYTYADTWIDYPDIKEDKYTARKVNCDEWKIEKTPELDAQVNQTWYYDDYQLGYMLYYHSHLPHFKGLNKAANDQHLNNWWHYIVDYNAAIRRERELQTGSGN